MQSASPATFPGPTLDPHMTDITGRTNGVWRALRPVDGDDMGLFWVCTCTQCNNETRVYPRARFVSGGTTARCKNGKLPELDLRDPRNAYVAGVNPAPRPKR